MINSRLYTISPQAKIGNNVTIKEYSVIEDDVEIGDNCYIGPCVFIGRGTRLGNGVRILHGSSIAIWPNSLNYHNEYTTVEIGDGTFIKGQSTVCKGTSYSYKTVIGKNCYIMNHCHIAHDNVIGDNVIISNGVNLGGHVEIDNDSNLGGMVGVHQFCKIGKYVMIESNTKVINDIPPYVLAARVPLRYCGVNTVGLRRKNFSDAEINLIKDFYRLFYDSGLNYSAAVQRIKEEFEITPLIKEIIDFIENRSTRGIVRK